MNGVSQAQRLSEGWKVQDFAPGGGLTPVLISHTTPIETGSAFPCRAMCIER
jgi:hypothetical protein